MSFPSGKDQSRTVLSCDAVAVRRRSADSALDDIFDVCIPASKRKIGSIGRSSCANAHVMKPSPVANDKAAMIHLKQTMIVRILTRKVPMN